LWLDYGIRLLIIAVAAWGGARWLSRPMHRLSGAAVALSQALARGQPAPSLDEGRGTAEVREAAQVFNQMARQLQQQFDARGLHMAAVSHDLRTPLTRLRMRLTRWPDATERQAAEADIHEMDELIGDTLAVLREQNDGSQARPIAVAAFIQALSDDLADQGVHVACTLPPVDVRVQAHPVALRRILGNLVGNALRHGGNAHVWATAVGQRVHMGVDDQGPGIPEAQLAQAFEPWMRLSDQGGADVPSPLMPNPSRTGHGLGLAIARDLAQRDGGEVTLNNRAEGGLRAVLNLPLYPLLPDSI
jgi:protein-histidine pros-kinase